MEPLLPHEIEIIRSVTLSQRLHLGSLMNQRARRRYQEKLERELPEWTEQERGRLLRAATTFGLIDTGEHWRDVYGSSEFQGWLAESGANAE
ncbi:MAG: hypothetical protein ABJF10_10300 [Chthoniobacter sp.]|uniref:hypothetical protein n=1 Tax=Chthoniobacter sp. TaxID=2510640 RepID=UPI0032A47645